MPSYLFLFGTTPDLSRVELETVLARQGEVAPPANITANWVSLETKKTLDIKKLVSSSGGMIKAGTLIEQNSPDPIKTVVDVLSKVDKPVFTIIGSPDSKDLSVQVKSALKKIGKSARFLLAKSDADSAVSKTPDLIEFAYIPTPAGYSIGQIHAVQNIDDWSKRDFDRPRVDPRSGMLPPKIARIMVNLSLPQAINPTHIVYDPFCGTGTILAEALMLGASVKGSDLSPEAVNQSSANLSWLESQYPLAGSWEVFAHDATTSPPSFSTPIESIVAEGYLGPPHPNPDNLHNLARGLQKLYIGALKRLSAVLPPGKRLVIALPRFRVNQTEITLPERAIDRCEKFGYTRILGPIIYARPNAQVLRSIYVLERN